MKFLFFRFKSWYFCLGFVLVLTGCKTVDSTSATKFATSVVTVRTQVNNELNAAATLTRDAGLTYVASQSTLSEADFGETPTSDIIAQWDNALATIETYALNLAALSSLEATKNFDAAATNLSNQFGQTAALLNQNGSQSFPQTSAELATAFSDVAHLILEAKAQADARKIAIATDPRIASILNLLAAEIGEDHSNACLRTTIYQTWNVDKNALTSSFLRAKDLAAKKTVAQQYANILAERAEQDESLDGLRHSLLALRDAHHALAQGNQISITASLTIVSNEVQRTQDLYNQLNSDLKK
jgi:hypothetical protein